MEEDMVQDLFAALNTFASKYLFWVDRPTITKTDIAEIIIITVLIYNILVWIKQTRAWNLLKGIIVVLVIVLIAAMFMGCTVRTCIQNRCTPERRLTVFRRHRICKIFPMKI